MQKKKSGLKKCLEIMPIKGGPTPNGKIHLKFPFWLFEPIPKLKKISPQSPLPNNQLENNFIEKLHFASLQHENPAPPYLGWSSKQTQTINNSQRTKSRRPKTLAQWAFQWLGYEMGGGMVHWYILDVLGKMVQGVSKNWVLPNWAFPNLSQIS